MVNVKHYVITSITLGAIAASSALLIGLTNLATKNKIATNEKERVQLGIRSIFGSEASIKEEQTTQEAGLTGSYKYVEKVFTVKDNADTSLGYAFRTTGSNDYGKVSLIVGFGESDHKFISVYIVVNEQTYASTLVDNYINPLNEGSRELDDTSCGATFGAKLVRNMVLEANTAAETLWKE